MNKICPTCQTKFEINKWQRGKMYCNDRCKPNGYVPSGNSVGRPKAKK